MEKILAVFFIGFFGGGILEYLMAIFMEILKRKPLRINHRFTLGKKISLISLPIWGILAILFTNGGIPYIMLFIMSAIVGTFFEFLVGKFFKKMFGVKIWTYRQGAIGSFTSFYSVPYWGAGGLVFAFLAKSMGL
jgi:uncharacterized membrane protein